jgi:hypothetical protein
LQRTREDVSENRSTTILPVDVLPGLAVTIETTFEIP